MKALDNPDGILSESAWIRSISGQRLDVEHKAFLRHTCT